MRPVGCAASQELGQTLFPPTAPQASQEIANDLSVSTLAPHLRRESDESSGKDVRRSVDAISCKADHQQRTADFKNHAALN